MQPEEFQGARQEPVHDEVIPVHEHQRRHKRPQQDGGPIQESEKHRSESFDDILGACEDQ